MKSAPAASGPPREAPARTPLSVSEVTERLARQLAVGFSSVCVMGEISQVKTVASGHTYFTLKDAAATLDAMVWADRRAGLSVEPKQGMRVVAMGAIRVFPASGRYSLHVDVLEPLGAGDLQRALEALKARLLAEGLFDESRKRQLPTFVRTLGLVTSPSGAVRHDIERTLAQGGARVRVLLSPTRVQGEGSALEIATAIGLLAGRDDVDAIIVARGGGSVEELWPFNDEGVARAIAASRPPVISAVGHETDFSVADLVADVRASTPSAAAGLIVELQRRAANRAQTGEAALHRAILALRDRLRQRLDAVSTHRVIEREGTKLERLRGRLASAFSRVMAGAEKNQAARRSVFKDLATRCEAQAPKEIFARAHARVDRSLFALGALISAHLDRQRARAARAFASKALGDAEVRLFEVFRRFTEKMVGLRRAGSLVCDRQKVRFGAALGKLDALSPLGVLGRGYALATTPAGRILMDAKDVFPGEEVVVRLAKGRLIATVTGRDEEVSERG